MSDLINRQDLRLMTVEEGIGHTIEYAQGWKACIDWIKTLPSAQQWIPCSERLPYGQTEVIVSCCDDSGDSKYNYTSCGWMTRDGEYWIVDNEINSYVIAWMPLPEPYEGEEKNEEEI